MIVFGDINFTMACIIDFLRVYNFPLVIIHYGVNWSHIKSWPFFPRLKQNCINTESHILAPPSPLTPPPSTSLAVTQPPYAGAVVGGGCY